MKITKQLGQEIIKRLSEYIEEDINIMDLQGKIVASTDQFRIGELHRGAVKALRHKEEVILNQGNMKEFPRTKPGINLPIIHQNKIRGVVGVSGDPADIRRVTGIIRVIVELILDQIYLQRQTFFKERQWNQWLHQLLHPKGFDPGRLEEDAIYSLGLNPEQSFRVTVFTGHAIHNYVETVRQEIAQSKIHTFFVLPFIEDEIVILLDPAFERINQLAANRFEHSGVRVRVGVGGVEYGIGGIRHSYKQAKQALTFAGEEDHISYIEDWKPERLIAAIPKYEYESVCKKYETLLESLGTEYIKTITVYFAHNFSIKETANYLHIHRNTLQYRLEQIKEKVGLDPRLFQDAFILNIVLNRKI